MPITSEIGKSLSPKRCPREKKPTITRIDNTVVVEKRLRVAAYCRVSTNSLNQEGSIEAQKAHMRDSIDRNPQWELIDVYCEAGLSGTKAETRPELMRLMEDCKRGRIDLVLTKSISRFSRNTVDCLEMVRTLTSLGVGVFFEKENINTSLMDGEFFLSVMACFATDESQSISQNLKWSYRKRFQQGIFKYKRAPYGYSCADGTLVINPDEAEVVREIFRRTINGDGAWIIAKDLKARGVPTKAGGEWQEVTVRDIVRNIVYTGDMLLQKTYRDETYRVRVNRGELDQYYVENHHEPVISQETYEAANAAMFARRKQYNSFRMTENPENAKKRLNRTVLTSKMICACCGSVLHRNTQRRSRKKRADSNDDDIRWVWVCSTHVRDKNLCEMKPIVETDVRNAFITMMNKLAFSQSTQWPIIDLFMERLTIDLQRRKNDELLTLNQSLSDIQRERSKLIALSQSAAIKPCDFNDGMIALLRREKEIREELAKMDGREAIQQVQTLKKTVTEIMKAPLTEFPEDLFSETVEKVVVYSKHYIRFILRCGMELTENYSY